MEGNRCLECVESIGDVEFVAKIGKFSTYLHNDGTKYRGAVLTYESAIRCSGKGNCCLSLLFENSFDPR